MKMIADSERSQECNFAIAGMCLPLDPFLSEDSLPAQPASLHALIAGHKPKLLLEQGLPKHIAASCVPQLCTAALHRTQVLGLHQQSLSQQCSKFAGKLTMVIGDVQAVTPPADCVLQSGPQQHAKRACLARLLTCLSSTCREARILVLSSAGRASKPRGGDKPAFCRRPASIFRASPSFSSVHSCCKFLNVDTASPGLQPT